MPESSGLEALHSRVHCIQRPWMKGLRYKTYLPNYLQLETQSHIFALRPDPALDKTLVLWPS